MSLHGVRLSLLDLSIVNDGATSADALRATIALGRHADDLGLHRVWVAEHHNMTTVACTSPIVLAGQIAAVTERIHVGTGGVMLPNHAPLVVAEQFALLEALYPGRVDVGIGRAPGSDPATAAAIRRGTTEIDDFPRDLLEVMALLGDVRTESGVTDRLRATPTATSFPGVYLLGSSDYSARLAAQLGLPFGFAHHFDMGGTLHAAEIYRDGFRPSAVLEEPHLIVTANVLAADTQEEADFHAAPGRLTALGRRTGRFIRLPSPVDALAHPDYDTAVRLPSGRLVGDADTVMASLEVLAERTRADEIMVTSVAHDLDARLHNLSLLAARWPN